MALGDQLASLAWGYELDDGDLIADAVVLCRFTRMGDGQSGVFVAKTEGSDTVTVLGLIEAARQIEAGEWEQLKDEA